MENSKSHLKETHQNRRSGQNLFGILYMVHFLLFFCTERQNHARELIREISLPEWDGIIIVSGDGLLHEVNIVTIVFQYLVKNFARGAKVILREQTNKLECTLVSAKGLHVNAILIFNANACVS